MARRYRLLSVKQEAFPKFLRYKDLIRAKDECLSGDQSVFVSFVLGIRGTYALGGLSTRVIGRLMLHKFCNGICSSLL